MDVTIFSSYYYNGSQKYAGYTDTLTKFIDTYPNRTTGGNEMK